MGKNNFKPYLKPFFGKNVEACWPDPKLDGKRRKPHSLNEQVNDIISNYLPTKHLDASVIQEMTDEIIKTVRNEK